jgi:hypothetical protein
MNPKSGYRFSDKFMLERKISSDFLPWLNR